MRRKLARWRDDNASGLKSAKPLKPAAFIGRPVDNWTLLWAIAELAGSDWAERARAAAERLSQDELVEPSWLELLLRELWNVFVKERRTNITSEQLVARLTADPISPWCEYGRGYGHKVTQREIAALLRKVRVRPRLVGENRVGGYHRKRRSRKRRFLNISCVAILSSSHPNPARKRRRAAARAARRREDERIARGGYRWVRRKTTKSTRFTA